MKKVARNKKKGNKTSAADFEIFEKECRWWIARLGLKGYAFHFEHSDNYSGVWKETSLASVYIQRNSRIVQFWLNKNWVEDLVTDWSVRSTAFHEVMEVFLDGLDYLISNRFILEGMQTEEIHKVIRTLENTFFKDDYDKRFTNGVSKRVPSKHGVAKKVAAPSGEEC